MLFRIGLRDCACEQLQHQCNFQVFFSQTTFFVALIRCTSTKVYTSLICNGIYSLSSFIHVCTIGYPWNIKWNKHERCETHISHSYSQRYIIGISMKLDKSFNLSNKFQQNFIKYFDNSSKTNFPTINSFDGKKKETRVFY